MRSGFPFGSLVASYYFFFLIDLFCLYPANLIFHKACAFSRFSVFKVRPGSSKASDRISGNRTPSLTVSVLFVFYKKVRQPPAFPGRRRPSIIGRKGLYLSVRDGYGCFPLTHRHRTFFLSLTSNKDWLTHGPLLLFPLSSSFFRKEVIQPHLPIRLPCYDFTPVTCPAVDRSLPRVGSRASGVTGSHGVTGGVYKTRERIHRGMLIRDY